MTPSEERAQRVCSELVPIKQELTIIAERLHVKQNQDHVYIAIEEPKRSVWDWFRTIASGFGWMCAVVFVYIGIGFIVAESIAWLMGAVK